MCSYFCWCWVITSTGESCPPPFSSLNILQLDWALWLLIFHSYRCCSRCAANMPSCWAAQFWHLAIPGFVLSSLCEKRESLCGWRNCQHTGVCTLQSYSLFVWLSCIGTFTDEQDSDVPGIKYWKKRRSPPAESLGMWERFDAFLQAHVKKKKGSKWTTLRRGNLSLPLPQSFVRYCSAKLKKKIRRFCRSWWKLLWKAQIRCR